MENKIYGLDLFSGIGGISFALKDWVTPIAYCESDPYAIGVLLSRMASGDIPRAGIWDDVRTLRKSLLPTSPDIVYGGFPCQDISVAGTGKGLGGERSGLFYEIVRLVDEIRPKFIFMENVPAIRTRGADKVVGELARLRYDARWFTLSASEIGANHERKRWWLLAHTMRGQQRWKEWENKVETDAMENAIGDGRGEIGARESSTSSEEVANAQSPRVRQLSKGSRRERQGASDIDRSREMLADTTASQLHHAGEGNNFEGRSADRSADRSWWSVEPNVGRVAHGIPSRVDRIKCLGNAVVPLQAKTAFKILCGLT